jgi:hypothetical protein
LASDDVRARSSIGGGLPARRLEVDRRLFHKPRKAKGCCWNRAAYTWNPVVKIGVTDDVGTYYHMVDSLAYDASTGVFAVCRG